MKVKDRYKYVRNDVTPICAGKVLWGGVLNEVKAAPYRPVLFFHQLLVPLLVSLAHLITGAYHVANPAFVI